MQISKHLGTISLALLVVLAIISTVPSNTTQGVLTGTVCLIPSGATSCPPSPASLTGPTGSQLRVSVFIQGSDSLNGFDVTLLADHAVLKPASVDLTGTVLPQPQIVVWCNQGILVQGASCSNTDTLDTLHLAAVTGPGQIVPSPVTGLLFTAVYNVTGTTSIPVGYQTGCNSSGSSVIGTTTCVTIANGTPTPVAETVQTANFSPGTGTPDFALSTSASSLSFAQGSSATDTVVVTSINNFTGTVTLSDTVTPAGLTAALVPSSLNVPSGGTATSSLTLSSSTPGTYTVTVTGASGTISHSATVTVMVTSTGTFSISATPSSLAINPGTSGVSTINVTSLNGFSGTISLTSTVTPSASGLATTLSPTSITLASGGTGSSRLTVSTSTSTPAGNYTVTVTGTSGSFSATTTVSVTVTSATPDFTITAIPSSVVFNPGSSVTSTITVSAINGFTGTVTLTVSVSSSNIQAAINPTSISGSGSATLTGPGPTPGTSIATVTGASGTLSHATTVTATVMQSGPIVGTVCLIQSGGTSCPSSQAVLSAPTGTQLRVSVFIQGSQGLNGFDITLLADHNVLKPVGVDMTGSVLTNPTILAECLQGVLVQGSTCSSTDTIDTLHLAAVAQAGSGLTPTPTTGLLFTAIYDVTGTASIPVGYQTGCSPNSSSVNGTTSCVTIANGTCCPVPETAQSAMFSGTAPSDFTISASPTSFSLKRGSSKSTSVTLASINGFNGTISLSAVVAPAGRKAPTGTLSATMVTLSSGGTITVVLAINAPPNTAPGTYTVTITGTSGSLSHSTTVAVTVTK